MQSSASDRSLSEPLSSRLQYVCVQAKCYYKNLDFRSGERAGKLRARGVALLGAGLSHFSAGEVSCL